MRRNTQGGSRQLRKTLPATQELELSGILQEHGKLYVVFKTGPCNRILPVAADDLLSFAAFKRMVARELGVLVSHASEREPMAELQAAAWSRAVKRARERGG